MAVGVEVSCRVMKKYDMRGECNPLFLMDPTEKEHSSTKECFIIQKDQETQFPFSQLTYIGVSLASKIRQLAFRPYSNQNRPIIVSDALVSIHWRMSSRVLMN